MTSVNADVFDFPIVFDLMKLNSYILPFLFTLNCHNLNTFILPAISVIYYMAACGYWAVAVAVVPTHPLVLNGFAYWILLKMGNHHSNCTVCTAVWCDERHSSVYRFIRVYLLE